MTSLFSEYIYPVNWVKIFDPSAYQSLHQSKTYRLKPYKSELPEYGLYAIFSDELVELDSSLFPLRSLRLPFKPFEPFTDDENNYGFSLGGYLFCIDSSRSLDDFIEAVSSLCIFTNIDYDFVFLKQIGEGSTSTVYLAEATNNSGLYAVKSINKAQRLDKAHTLLLISEINILRKLNHPSILKLFSVYEDKENLYLVMEYFASGDLFHRILRNGQLSERDSARFMKELLEVLEYIHKKGIVHRDIKLENIVMTQETGVKFKLIDFGLSYESEKLQNMRCGSPGYIAPEILRNQNYNHKIDIYSAGVVLYIMLYGKNPFCASNMYSIMEKNIKGRIQFDNSASEDAIEIMRMALNKNPKKRPSASKILKHPWFNMC
jgi:calcium/calmodulin-dependent protein kinase I